MGWFSDFKKNVHGVLKDHRQWNKDNLPLHNLSLSGELIDRTIPDKDPVNSPVTELNPTVGSAGAGGIMGSQDFTPAQMNYSPALNLNSGGNPFAGAARQAGFSDYSKQAAQAQALRGGKSYG